MAISTNSIIHYTNKLENLFSILDKGFKVHYCSENVETSDGRTLQAAFPMISFCDIPLSQVKNHIDSYGYYGIGLNKDWAKSYGMNPIFYFDKDSEFLIYILNEFDRMLKRINNKEIEYQDFVYLIKILSYSKNYESDLDRLGKKIENYRFYDEREWRYVPDKKVLKDKDSFLTYAEYKDKKKEFNDNIDDIRITFKPKDITYLIVKGESDISKTTKTIRTLFEDRCTLKEMEILLTRIITADQIKNDF